jgi:polyhydroxybutyrate depolymerase
LKAIFIILIAGALFSAIALSINWQVAHYSNKSLVSGGVKRRYLLYVPASYDPFTPTPLVISMHGFKDFPARQMRKSSWNNLAKQEGFIVVYPMGAHIPLRWQLYDYENSANNPTADIRFISNLIDRLEQEYNIDPARIYANGLSNGGGMALALACALSERIAAVGSVAGTYFYPLDACQQTRPVPIIAFHGTADRIVPYNGGPSKRFDYPFPSIPDFMQKLAQRNQCKAVPIEQAVSQNVQSVFYSGCAGGADVVLYTIEGGGHSWPGDKFIPRMGVGKTSQEISATRLMWEFFEAHSLSKPAK